MPPGAQQRIAITCAENGFRLFRASPFKTLQETDATAISDQPEVQTFNDSQSRRTLARTGMQPRQIRPVGITSPDRRARDEPTSRPEPHATCSQFDAHSSPLPTASGGGHYTATGGGLPRMPRPGPTDRLLPAHGRKKETPRELPADRHEPSAKVACRANYHTLAGCKPQHPPQKEGSATESSPADQHEPVAKVACRANCHTLEWTEPPGFAWRLAAWKPTNGLRDVHPRSPAPRPQGRRHGSTHPLSPPRNVVRSQSAKHHSMVLRLTTLRQVEPRDYSPAAICVRNVDVHVKQFT
jgi:hypothetical protein